MSYAPSALGGDYAGLTIFRAKRPTAYSAPSPAANPSAMMLVVAHVRQALQHTAAIGAWSPYFAATWVIRPCHTVFMGRIVMNGAGEGRRFAPGGVGHL